MTFAQTLIKANPPISSQMDADELGIVIENLDRTLANNTTGDVVELGCYAGTTSLYISRVLAARNSTKTFYVYDSFEGLPDKTIYDASPIGENFTKGMLAVSKRTFITHYRKAHLSLPKIYKGWFQDIKPSQLPFTICFAFLDGDFYESIAQSLRLIEPLLSPGALIIVDDYQSEALPGAAKAVNEWVAHTGWKLQSQASLAIIQKPLK